ncbi:uncharacterized protein [Mobula birostris]|uniref:uncharacterized protein isoform X2 n=1 Tax=Mobula birostris TaxID=1983395 RepID=UPI003B28C661
MLPEALLLPKPHFLLPRASEMDPQHPDRLKVQNVTYLLADTRDYKILNNRVLLKTLTWSYTLTVVHCGNRTCSRGFTNDRYLARQGRDLKALLTFGGPRFCVSGDRGGLEVSVWAGGWCVVGDGRSKAVCPGTQVLWARSSEKATQQTFNIVNQRVGCYVFPLTEKRRHLFHPY